MSRDCCAARAIAMSHLPVQRRDDELEDNDEDSVPPPPPDGGWGWAVVFGSFMIHIVSKFKNIVTCLTMEVVV